MAFPSTLSTFNRPSATDRLNSPSHSALHNTVSSALGQVEAVIGVDGANSVVGTMMYNLRSPASDGGGHIQTANKGGTGQTTYTKGDILVAQSSSVLTKLAIGSDGAVLTANSSVATGVQWKSGQVTITSFLSSGIWTKPTGISFIQVQAWGGGGSGGVNTAGGVGSGGGGGGAYVFGSFAASLLSATEAVNIGAGGASIASAANGNAGGTTVFGTASLLTAYGGGGGGGNLNGTSAAGGGGGGVFTVGQSATGSVAGIGGRPGAKDSGNGTKPGDIAQDNHFGGGGGDIESPGRSAYGGGGGAGGGSSSGNAGAASKYGGGGGGGASGSSGNGGAGGASELGGAGGAGGNVGAGTAGTQPGGGGGGGYNAKSGKGGDGKVIVYEYY